MSAAEDAAYMSKRIKKPVPRKIVLRLRESRSCKILRAEQLEFPAFEAELQVRNGAIHHLILFQKIEIRDKACSRQLTTNSS